MVHYLLPFYFISILGGLLYYITALSMSIGLAKGYDDWYTVPSKESPGWFVIFYLVYRMIVYNLFSVQGLFNFLIFSMDSNSFRKFVSNTLFKPKKERRTTIITSGNVYDGDLENISTERSFFKENSDIDGTVLYIEPASEPSSRLSVYPKL